MPQVNYAMEASLSHESLAQKLSYDKRTGIFRHRKSVGLAIKGAVAGRLGLTGYRSISVNCRRFYAHRLAWFYVFKTWPPKGLEIDHADGNKDNNAIKNLRLATRSQNNVNRAGLATRHIRYRDGRWSAGCYKDRKHHHIGTFATKREAISVALRKAEELHGEFYPKTKF